ncbi:MAG: hypothetical protein IPM74_12410 [Crocinitomicaceae bacterium]|nr:hypothetical protein [Crocinitomicaceae bacterium]MBK8926678.1 hypothetical protein [Crocinitomicaceae bacterium]
MFSERNEQIKAMAENFISDGLKNENPAGLCFTTSFALMIYLYAKGIKTEIRSGTFPKLLKDGSVFNVAHFWLQVDQEGTVLDATYNQFNDQPSDGGVYLGRLEDHELTQKYKVYPEKYEDWFPEVWSVWSMPYEDTTYPIKGDIERSLTYSLKIATRLLEELIKLNVQDDFLDEQFGLFFKPVYTLLHHVRTGKINFKLVETEMTSGFENLMHRSAVWAKEEGLQ